MGLRTSDVPERPGRVDRVTRRAVTRRAAVGSAGGDPLCCAVTVHPLSISLMVDVCPAMLQAHSALIQWQRGFFS